MGRFTLAPAGGVGRGLWEGSWHGRWRGRVHDQLTQLAGRADRQRDARRTRHRARDRHGLRRRDRCGPTCISGATSAGSGTRPTIRWSAPKRASPPIANINASPLDNIRSDLAGHIRRRLTYGLFVLWSADIWVRYSDINATAAARHSRDVGAAGVDAGCSRRGARFALLRARTVWSKPGCWSRRCSTSPPFTCRS